MRPRKPTFFCRSSPSTFKFSSNYKYVGNVYVRICFCYSIPLKELRADIRFSEGFRDVTKEAASVASLRPLIPLPRSHGHR
jgi:hypothetical protein